MAGVFACPECGQELGVEGVSPGREVQCEACSTWVEVPFLPRNLAMRRTRRPGRSPWASTGLRAAVGFVVVALLGLVASRVIGGRVRSDRERVLAELVASAERAESSSQYDVALREVEAALAHARTFEREGSGRLGELAGRRDRTSLLEAKARLAAVDALDPDHAVGESLTLAKRAGCDFNARRFAILRVPWRVRSPLAELGKLRDRQVVAGQMQHAVEQCGGVAVRQHEPVTIGPERIRRVVLHDLVVEQVGDGRATERGARVAGLGRFHGVNG